MKFSDFGSRGLVRALGVVCGAAVVLVVAGATFVDGPAAALEHDVEARDHDHDHPGPTHNDWTPLSELGGDSLTGFSGALRMRFVRPNAGMEIAAITRFFGDSAARLGSIHSVPLEGETFSFVLLRPFGDKVGGRIGTYRIGNWPNEGGTPRTAAYKHPPGFIEVTRENQDTHISRHFRLRDFLTKDQHDVWPKYLVLDERLVDKLELVIQDLQERGYGVRRMAVMSGFRTPQYNARGVRPGGGRASNSRHTYGDAADVFVDNTGNGRMDDLNGDGRVDSRDARIIIESVERVERRFPQLVGGLGLYGPQAAGGPFVHIDARGQRARWGIN